MDQSQLAAVLLVVVAAGGIAYALIYPLLSGDAKAEKRQKALLASPEPRKPDRTAAGITRRDQVAQTLKELEQRASAEKPTIEKMIAQAGLDITKQQFYLGSAVCGVVVGLVLFVLSGIPLVGLAGIFVGALGVPRWILGFLLKRRIAKFVDELPGAMDIIVRGLRAGLPLTDCIRLIASEAREPLRSEFRTVIEGQAIGMPLAEGLSRIHQRVPVPEANFLAIVVTIQQKSGGNLSEAINNLSRVIRDRKKMKGKIKAMSMEAKASAAVIGALPFLVGFSCYFTSPDYISILWTTSMGQILMGGTLVWMFIGVLVMRKMINFQI